MALASSGSSAAVQERNSTLSLAHKSIRLREQRPEQASEIARFFNLSPVAARVLAARGYVVDDKLKHYLNPTLKEGLPDPRGMKNLDLAVDIVSKAIDDGAGIGIACDFDVDGLSGGAQVFHFLQVLGAKVQIFVPDRFADGYGLNSGMIEKMAQNGLSVLIAIDFGTTNLKEIELAKKLGLKTVVIDHHHVGDHKIVADAFINPQQEGCGFAGKIMCASGLAWYFLVALKQKLKRPKDLEIRSYLDLACLGTICDMVPLVGVNRVIAKRGMEILGTTSRSGLIALKNTIGISTQVGCSDISFGIGPRLNAAGRMVHGELVIDLLTTADTDGANRLAKRLHKLNAERQETEAGVKDLAMKQVSRLAELPAGLVAWDKSFHTGVIGIVAQRLVEAYYRPAVVMGEDSEGIFKGSVRGIKGFSVVDCLSAPTVSKHLLKYGGHDGAGGLSVELKNIPAFAEAFVDECQRRIRTIETEPSVDCDTEVTLKEIDVNLIKELKQFAPFGMGNPNPTVLIKDLKVCETKVLKDAHLKALLTDGRCYITGLLWRHTSHPAIKVGSRIDIACRPEFSTFNGVTELQANLQAIESV